MRRRAGYGALALLAAAAACGDEVESGRVGVSSVADAGAPPPPPSSPPLLGDAGAPDASQPPVGVPRCTGDLTGIIGADGTLATTCPSDQLCADAACRPACEAAAKAKGADGCDFLLATPPLSVTAPCFLATVTNTSRRPLAIKVSRDGADLPVASFTRISRKASPLSGAPVLDLPADGLPPGFTAFVYLSHTPGLMLPSHELMLSGVERFDSFECPVAPAVAAATDIDPGPALANGFRAGAGRGKAFRIQTSMPATVHDFVGLSKTFGNDPQTSSSLVFPTSMWGTQYRAVGPHFLGTPDISLWNTTVLPSFGQIVATQDGTTVTIVPKDDLPGGAGIAPAPHALPATYSLGAGEILQWEGVFDWSGSLVKSNKPIGVIAGSRLTGFQGSALKPGQHWAPAPISPSMPTAPRSAVHHGLFPDAELGWEYAGAPFESRVEGSWVTEFAHYQIVGVVDGTKLTFEPALGGLPATIDAGGSAWFMSNLGFVVRSQDAAHPFTIAQVASAGWGKHYADDPGPIETAGAHFFPLPGTDRYLTRYPHTPHNIVRKSTAGKFSPVESATPCLLGGSFAGFPALAGFTSLGATFDWQPPGLGNPVLVNGKYVSPCSAYPATIVSKAPFFGTVTERIGSAAWLGFLPGFGGRGASDGVPREPGGGTK